MQESHTIQPYPLAISSLEDEMFDVAIVGGGMAGLALSIQCARAGYKVVLFEKDKFPFHKVCGEYISLESWNFLEELGVPLSDMQLPLIRRLIVSAPNGKFIEQQLPLGGFGISRYKIDYEMAQLAKLYGVALMEESRVTNITFQRSAFTIQGVGFSVRSRVACGTFGKRSNLDVRWKRNFINQKGSASNRWLAVKYHIKTLHPSDLIALHNFEEGYCGISQIEGNKCCLCYLTTADNLSKSNHNISLMEEKIVLKNPFLKKIFSAAEFLYDEPLVISRISFSRKSQVENHVLLIGDAAGMITPLCGNGMSMALHGSKLAFGSITDFLEKKIDRYEMETQYIQQWEKNFAARLQTGRLIQHFFGSVRLSNLIITSLKPFPKFISFLIRRTHGQPF